MRKIEDALLIGEVLMRTGLVITCIGSAVTIVDGVAVNGKTLHDVVKAAIKIKK